MQTEQLIVDRQQARELYRKYRAHSRYSKPVDDEIRRTYQLIAQGRMVIKAIDSIAKAGLGEDGLPKLAIVRADAERCYLTMTMQGGCWFGIKQWVREHEGRTYIRLPDDSFPRPTNQRFRRQAESMVPIIPLDLRPKRGLENYHILYEAEWRKVVPVDPMLLRRIGKADLWVVLAAWELTPVEQAVLAGRLNG